MNRINTIIDGVCFYLVSAALAALVGICFAQVVARYVFNASFSWAEEVSVILMVWATWVGASLAVKQGTHLRILIVVDKVEPTTKVILQLALNGLGIVFLTFVGFTSRVIIDGMASQTLLSLSSVPMNVMYISVPIGCILMIYYLLRTMFTDRKSLRALARKQE